MLVYFHPNDSERLGLRAEWHAAKVRAKGDPHIPKPAMTACLQGKFVSVAEKPLADIPLSAKMNHLPEDSAETTAKCRLA
jgi:hypothetical protein